MSNEARLLLSAGFKMAVAVGARAAVEHHLARGASPNATDEQGRTALMHAAGRGQVEICRILIRSGADVAQLDNEGRMALDHAQSGLPELTILLTPGARIAAGDEPASPPDIGLMVAPLPGAASFDSASVEPPLVEAAPTNDAGLHVPVARSAEAPADSSTPTRGADLLVSHASPVPEPVLPAVSETALGATEAPFDTRESVIDPEDAAWGVGGIWLAAPEVAAPPINLAPIDSATAVQAQIAAHKAIDTDEAWDDIELDLPLVNARSLALLDDVDRQAEIRRCIHGGMVRGSIRRSDVEVCASEVIEDHSLPVPELLEALVSVLGDLDIRIEDDQDFWLPQVVENAHSGHPNVDSEGADELEDRVWLETDEAWGHLTWLLSSDVEPLSLYTSDLKQPLLSREDEREIGEAVEAALNEVRDIVDAIPEVSCWFRSVPSCASSKDEVDDENGDDSKSAIRILTTRMLDEVETRCAMAADECLNERLARALSVVRRQRQRLLLANLRLAVWQARRYGGLTLEDRIQAGNIGLMRAVECFDYRREVRFATYAIWWIRQSISRHVADNALTVRVPVHAHDILATARKLERQGDSPATDPDALARLVGSFSGSSKAVERVIAASVPPLPIHDETVADRYETASIHEVITPEAATLVLERTDRIDRILGTLKPQQAEIVRLRFGIGCEREHTLEEVGQMFGVTRERIRQIEAKALARLSHPKRLKHLKDLRD